MRRIILALSGASGMPLAATLLRQLSSTPSIEVHLIISSGAELVLQYEDKTSFDDVFALAHTRHAATNMAAGPASGSWQHDGMIVCPCSMTTLASIAHGTGSNLIHRAADVTLKERRPLVLVTRETPLSRVHLRNMLLAEEAGATIMPPSFSFYTRPTTIDELLNHLVGRILDQIHIPHTLGKRWTGTE